MHLNVTCSNTVFVVSLWSYCVIMRTCVTMVIHIYFLLLLAQFIYKISYKDQVTIDKDTLPLLLRGLYLNH